MKARSKITGIVAALSLALLALLPLLRSSHSVAAQSPKVPLFFMQPPEFPLGVSRHPFHATVTADWRLTRPRGGVFRTETTGNVWRDGAGDVRVEGAMAHSGHNSVQLPSSNVLFLAANGTMLSWKTDATSVTSFRSAHLEYSNRFFENLTVPKAFLATRSYELNCLQGGVACATEPLVERVIEGIRVQGTRYKETIPAVSLGAPNDVIVTRDVWRDPKMEVVVEIDGTDPLFGNFELRLSGISGGDQKKDLFEAPTGSRVNDITPPSGLPSPGARY